MRQTELNLTKRDRLNLRIFRSKGSQMVRELNRAHILVALDSNVAEAEIMQVLGVGRTAIWRTRTAYLQGGLDFALHDMPRPGQPRQYQTDDEAQVTALACSEPPSGARHWTVALLTEAARHHPTMHDISRETIRRFLKKLPQTLAQTDVVYRPPDRGIPEPNVRSARTLRPTLPETGACSVH